MTPRQAVKAAIKAAGGGAKLARAIGSSRQAVAQWVQFPIPFVLKVEELYGIPRHESRPDVYPPPAPEKSQGASPSPE